MNTTTDNIREQLGTIRDELDQRPVAQAANAINTAINHLLSAGNHDAAVGMLEGIRELLDNDPEAKAANRVNDAVNALSA